MLLTRCYYLLFKIIKAVLCKELLHSTGALAGYLHLPEFNQFYTNMLFSLYTTTIQNYITYLHLAKKYLATPLQFSTMGTVYLPTSSQSDHAVSIQNQYWTHMYVHTSILAHIFTMHSYIVLMVKSISMEHNVLIHDISILTNQIQKYSEQLIATYIHINPDTTHPSP